eukprot:m.169139 g.169139  ORF g.169139 m.169139 type:complete len:745 (-) comp16472_c4_seq1:369-2603(-)
MPSSTSSTPHLIGDEAFDHTQEIEREHHWTLEEIAAKFPESKIELDEDGKFVQAGGLSTEEAERRLGLYGHNMLTPGKRRSQWRIFLSQLANAFMIMLLIAAVLSFIAYIFDPSQNVNLWLGLILMLVVFGTSFAAYWQERKSSNLMEEFSKMTPLATVVIRDGVQAEIQGTNLAIGDIVAFKEGDVVPADVRLLQVNVLKVECSSLTGESVPIACEVEPVPEDVPARESHCLAFSGSLCLQGTAVGVVIRTGDYTMIGRIATVTTETSAIETQLTAEIRRFVKFVAVLAISMATVFFIIGVARQQGNNAIEIFINGFIIVIVANVPQGLPATVTSMLTVTARRMADHSVFVKRLQVVETLGSASVIATDKTGTLTQNIMSAREVWCNGEVLDRNTLSQYLPQDGHLAYAEPPCVAIHWLLTVGCVCNSAARSRLEEIETSAGMQQGEQEYVGNPSDVALLRLVEDCVDADEVRHDFRRMFEIPFNSRSKFQLVVCKPRTGRAKTACRALRQASEEGKAESAQTASMNARESFDGGADNVSDDIVVAMLKGAPEVILQRCIFHLQNGVQKPVDEAFRRRFGHMSRSFARQSRRLIGLCVRLLPPTPKAELEKEWTQENVPKEDYVFLGFATLADPPRDNVDTAVAQCHTAGIKVFMVTGDHAITAAAIAREVGILQTMSCEASQADEDGDDVGDNLDDGNRLAIEEPAEQPEQLQAVEDAETPRRATSEEELDARQEQEQEEHI